MGKIKSPHDTFVRAILADKNVAVDYFKSYLPAFVSEKLDFDTLTQTGDSYVSRHLREIFSDVVFTCQRKDAESEVKVSLLIEHKSYIDKYVPIQLGGYIFSGVQKQIDNKEKLSIIIPILFITEMNDGNTKKFRVYLIIWKRNGNNSSLIFRMFTIVCLKCPISNWRGFQINF